jgi:predicted N-acetyltransferase YhbS
MIGLKRNEIGHLYVDPSCGGRGIGGALAAFAVEAFLRAGYDHAIMLGSLNAASFYARCGFVEESRGSFLIGGGLNLDYVRMRRPLRSA